MRGWGWAMAGNRLSDGTGSFHARMGQGRAATGVLMAPGFVHMPIGMSDSRGALIALSFVLEFGWQSVIARRAMVPHIRGRIMLDENYA